MVYRDHKGSNIESWPTKVGRRAPSYEKELYAIVEATTATTIMSCGARAGLARPHTQTASAILE
jgi:hypothetical protein